MRKIIHLLAACLAAFSMSGCRLDPFETLGPSEHGVVFSALPPLLGGGIKKTVYSPKQKVFLMPWDTLYHFDTGLQTLSWGAKGEGDNQTTEDSVHTRAIDGNEVLLSMTVTYRVIPEKLPYIVQRVGASAETIRKLITFVSRADIRTHMNYLHTNEVQLFEARQRRVEQVKSFMNERLQPEGIEVVDVIFDKALFYREKLDGTLDTSYQDQINETEQTSQKTEQERNRSKTVEEEMKQKFAEAEGAFFKVSEQADGILRQAEQRAQAKYEARVKDAERIHTVGLLEVEGMKKELEALSGPGGRALLRKEIAQALIERDPKFVVLNPSGGSGEVSVNKLDTNALVQQLGIITGVEPNKTPEKPAKTVSQPSSPQPESSQ